MVYTSFHPDSSVMPPEPPEGDFWQFRGTDHFYVDLYHTDYQRLRSFPFGLLNVVGYWAEAELFGGVVLFERGGSSSEVRMIPVGFGNGRLTNIRSSTLSYTHSTQLMLFSSLRNSSNVSQTWEPLTMEEILLARRPCFHSPKTQMPAPS